ncbi:ribonuclease R [Novisyntrophococcus fermenticellae]|uniref:ribonuclease R n=1 Tax=Novisyntrophococcus fermenticellae TaxID=2068655 RepID=UPI002E788D4E|nr:ribonuclease R [Novisyntrophococcus fermenticellae]
MINKKKNINKIQKKIILDLISSKNYVPMKTKEIAVLLQIPRNKKRELQDILDTLEAEGQIVTIHRGRYKKKKIKSEIREGGSHGAWNLTGTFISHPKGYGFVERHESDEEDIFIPAPYTGDAFHMDEVEVALLPEKNGSRQEGRVVRVLAHGIGEIVGTFERSASFGFVVADNSKITRDIFIPKEFINNAVTGDKVIVQITRYGGNQKSPEGKVTEVLGQATDPGVDVLSVARVYDIPMVFPARVLSQADRCPDHVQESDRDGRLDLRDWPMVTIDGEDAKDLDDAVSLTIEDGLYKLGVHIADVSNYVQGGSALDREALKRGTSVYLVDRVIPMLPKKLSNGICSLNAGEDRLAMSCIMWIDGNGHTVQYKLAETVICVDQRMTYTDVNKILTDSDDKITQKYFEFVPMFRMMKQLSDILRSIRKKRGAIDFDFPESKIILNNLGKPVDIKPHERNAATDLIEDFMLQANETVAKEYFKREIPFLYRTHENPDMEKMEPVLTFIRNQGIEVTKSMEEITPKEIQDILSQVKGAAIEPLISRLLLRSMKQARYSIGCIGHYGLAARYYCHFTSPIRRYPDLQIHRIIKDDLRGRLNEEKMAYYRSILDDVAKQTSATERRAEEAERETDKMKMAEYMYDHIDEVYEGTVSGVTGWGLYVELPNTIEGLVHVNALMDDYYHFDEENYRLVGNDTGNVYRLGDKVKVRVAEADISNKTIDFLLEK